MATLTQKEKETLLILFKDFTNYYNANSISKVLNISRIGSMKILKKLLNENLLTEMKIGKSTIYKIKIDDDYVRSLMVFLLADEANNFKRWKEEFKELFREDRIIIIYGSIIKNYSKAEDIDIMIIINKSEYKEINKVIKRKQGMLSKKIHSIELTSDDFLQNIKQRKKSMIGIVKNAIVLYGQNKYVNIMENVTSI